MGQAISLKCVKEAMATPWEVRISFAPASMADELKEQGYLLDCGVSFANAKDKRVTPKGTNTESKEATKSKTKQTKHTLASSATNASSTVKFGWTGESNQQYVRDRRQNNRAHRRRGAAPSPEQMNDVVGSTLTHIIGCKLKTRNQWKIQLPTVGTYRCTVLVGDPSFPTLTNLTCAGDTSRYPPQKVIHELKLACGVQKEITFDIKTDAAGEICFYNSSSDSTKKNAVKLCWVRFEMLGGNYDKLLNNNGITSTFVTDLVARLYHPKELNLLFGPEEQDTTGQNQNKTKRNSKTKRNTKSNSNKVQAQLIGSKYHARSRQGLDEQGSSAMRAHIRELSAMGCGSNETNEGGVNGGGDGGGGDGNGAASDDHASNTSVSKQKTMSVLIRTLAHGTKNDIPSLVCASEKRLLVLTRMLHDMMKTVNPAPATELTPLGRFKTSGAKSNKRTKSKGSSNTFAPPLYGEDVSIKIMTELLNKLARGKQGVVPDDATCLADLFNFGRLKHATDRSKKFTFQTSKGMSPSTYKKRTKQKIKQRKQSALAPSIMASRAVQNLMRYLQHYTMKSTQTDLLHVFQLSMFGRAATVRDILLDVVGVLFDTFGYFGYFSTLFDTFRYISSYFLFSMSTTSTFGYHFGYTHFWAPHWECSGGQ